MDHARGHRAERSAQPPRASEEAAPGGGAAAVPDAYWRRYGIQRKESGAAPSGDLPLAAARGIAGPAGPLPHLDAIQRSFGRHDVGGVQAHVGGAAASAAAVMGAKAYAVGDHVACAAPPDLHTAAHEAAHVVQQRAGVHLKGGVGEAGDAFEQHADAVADLVVAGRSAEALLDRHAGGGGRPTVQRLVGAGLQPGATVRTRDGRTGTIASEDRDHHRYMVRFVTVAQPPIYYQAWASYDDLDLVDGNTTPVTASTVVGGQREDDQMEVNNNSAKGPQHGGEVVELRFRGNTLRAAVGEQLAKGDAGVVHKLDVLQPPKDVPPAFVLKIPHEDGTTEAANEAEKLAQVKPVNIVALVDVIKHRGVDCLVLEYIPGQTMTTLLESKQLQGPENWGRLRRLLRDLLLGLAELHGRGVTHCDLHPGNVMVAEQGAKIIDLGKSQSIGGKKEEDLDLGGTDPEYAAPEQGEQPPEPSQDMFRVGQMVVEIMEGQVIGKPMLKNRTSNEMFQSKYTDAQKLAEDLGQLGKRGDQDRPKGYADFVSRLLDPNPKARMTAEQALSHPFLG